MTLERLAESAGISPNFLGKIERGQSVPSLETLVKIANALCVGVDALLGAELVVFPQTLRAEVDSLTAGFAFSLPSLVIVRPFHALFFKILLSIMRSDRILAEVFFYQNPQKLSRLHAAMRLRRWRYAALRRGKDILPRGLEAFSVCVLSFRRLTRATLSSLCG